MHLKNLNFPQEKVYCKQMSRKWPLEPPLSSLYQGYKLVRCREHNTKTLLNINSQRGVLNIPVKKVRWKRKVIQVEK